MGGGLVGALEGGALGFLDHFEIGAVGGGIAEVLAADFPGGGDDIALELDQLLSGTGFAGGGGFAVLLLGAGVALAEDFVEGPGFGEVEVGGGAAGLAIGAEVIGPGEPGDELVGLELEVFEGEDVGKGVTIVGGGVGGQGEELSFFADALKTDAVGEDAVVVPNGAVEADFLDRRGAEIAAWGDQAEFGDAIGEDLEDKGDGGTIGSAPGIFEVQEVGAGVG